MQRGVCGVGAVSADGRRIASRHMRHGAMDPVRMCSVKTKGGGGAQLADALVGQRVSTVQQTPQHPPFSTLSPPPLPLPPSSPSQQLCIRMHVCVYVCASACQAAAPGRTCGSSSPACDRALTTASHSCDRRLPPPTSWTWGGQSERWKRGEQGKQEMVDKHYRVIGCRGTRLKCVC